MMYLNSILSSKPPTARTITTDHVSPEMAPLSFSSSSAQKTAAIGSVASIESIKLHMKLV